METLEKGKRECKAGQARWFRRSRKALGLDVKSMAQRLNVSPRTINAWENESNDNLPSREKVFQYLVLMARDPQRLDPPAIIQRFNADGPLVTQDGATDHTISAYFSRLSTGSKRAVNLLIRSLYKGQKFRRGQQASKDKQLEA